MGPPGNRGLWGPLSLPTPTKAHEKANERYLGHLIGPPTDPGPLGSARVAKWSVRSCLFASCVYSSNICVALTSTGDA
ncbi:unnamed protein product [Staurois parvus]|uniref:Uncharacterized protein n=1 Tax=Staurois parvus TaxID=386267 RepID=A0ABN9CU51_9NEOB|nr:unnamed protein product [Staurois parvus]